MIFYNGPRLSGSDQFSQFFPEKKTPRKLIASTEYSRSVFFNLRDTGGFKARNWKKGQNCFDLT